MPASRRRGSISGMVITANSIAHVRLTVTAIERSARFYESVFGWPVLLEVPDNADEATRKQLGFLLGGVIYDLGGALIALRPAASDRFHEDRAGLDHIAFRTADKAELDSAAEYLDELGIDHEPVKDIGPSYILEFRDPDNIALELTAPELWRRCGGGPARVVDWKARCLSSSTTPSLPPTISGSPPSSSANCSGCRVQSRSVTFWPSPSNTAQPSTTPRSPLARRSDRSITLFWFPRTTSTRSTARSRHAGCSIGPIRPDGGPASSTPTTAGAESTSRPRAAPSWRSSPDPTGRAASPRHAECAGDSPGRGSRRPTERRGRAGLRLRRQPGWSAPAPSACWPAAPARRRSAPRSGRSRADRPGRYRGRWPADRRCSAIRRRC